MPSSNDLIITKAISEIDEKEIQNDLGFAFVKDEKSALAYI
ncbi:MAG: hypothetical protein U0T83_02545 [Bacteriovoracaceae bacterium]